MEQPDRHESRRERSHPVESGSSPAYNGGSSSDKWEMSDNLDHLSTIVAGALVLVRWWSRSGQMADVGLAGSE